MAPARVAITVMAQISMNTSSTRAPGEIGFLIDEEPVSSCVVSRTARGLTAGAASIESDQARGAGEKASETVHKQWDRTATSGCHLACCTQRVCGGGAVSISSDRQFEQPENWFAPLSVQDSVVGGRHTLVLTGELDIAQAAAVESVLARVSASGTVGITLDLSGLTFMGSTGVRVVLLARELCERGGYEFRVIPGPANVQQVFKLTGVSDVLPFQELPDVG
jgi:anti-sigma B factor antagonist